MPISQEDSKVLAAVFGEEVANKLSGAVTEDMTLGLRLNGKVLSLEDQKAMKDTAIIQGKELGYKEIAKNLELTLEAGEKDPAIIAEKFKTVLSGHFEQKYKNQTPTEETIALAKKASEYEEKNKKLLETLGAKEREAGEWQEKFTKKENETKEEKLNNKILASFPEKMNQDRGDALLIARSHIQFEEVDGKLAAKVEGKIVLDALGEPESIDNVIKAFVDKKGWVKASGMGGSDRSGGSSSGPKGMTPDQARDYLKSKGIAPTSPEGLKLFSEMIKK